jgi:hypothetical protein
MATGNFNTGVGEGVFEHATSGDNNTVVGQYAMVNSTGASDNTSIGFQSALAAIGNQNTSLGSRAGRGLMTGADNVSVGYAAGDTETAANANATGSNNVFVGTQAGPGAPAQISNAIALGSQAHPTASNRAVIGNGSVTDVYFGSEAGLATLHAANIGPGATSGVGVRYLSWSCTGGATGRPVSQGESSSAACGSAMSFGQVMTRNCTLQRLWVRVSAGGSGASDGIVTVQQNNAVTAIACSAGTGVSCSDTTHTLAASAGDLISIKVVTVSAASRIFTVSAECQ